MNKKIVVLVSGGLDSAVALAQAIEQAGAAEVLALNMFYGQKHACEQTSFENLVAYYGVDKVEVNLESAFSFSNCPLLAKSTEELPQGDYATQETDASGIVKTYVPFRNGLFLSYAAAIAYSVGAQEIRYGAHADDAMGNAYPDCGEFFIAHMMDAISYGTGHAVRLQAPFWRLTKKDIVKIGLDLKVPLHLTWSCYEGAEEEICGDTFIRACGTCGTCIDRKKAFEANGIADPLSYKE